MPSFYRLSGMIPASTEKTLACENVCIYYKKFVKFACNYFKNSSASAGLHPQGPRPPTGYRPWTSLGTLVPQTSCGFAPLYPKPPAAYSAIASLVVISETLYRPTALHQCVAILNTGRTKAVTNTSPCYFRMF